MRNETSPLVLLTARLASAARNGPGPRGPASGSRRGAAAGTVRRPLAVMAAGSAALLAAGIAAGALAGCGEPAQPAAPKAAPPGHGGRPTAIPPAPRSWRPRRP